MSILKLNEQILIVNDSLQTSEVIKRLASLPSKTLSKFFKKNKLILPVGFKREAFLKTLYETALMKVKDKNIKFEEKVLFEALPSLTVYQLTKMLEKLDSDLLNKKYKEELWSLVLENLLENDLDEKILTEFLYLDVKRLKQETIYQYNINLFDIFADEKDTLEGLSYNRLRVVLYKTISKDVLIDLGKLHGVSISKKLNIKEGIEQLLKQAKHSKPYYKPVTDDSVYEQTLAKVYGMMFKEDALIVLSEEQVIKEIHVVKEEVKAIKHEIIEMQHLEIVLDED